eukprot:Filipodium_phascolosomae@DN4580_c0_g1_i1.p1
MGSKGPMVLGIGNPLLDMVAEVPNAVFEAYGVTKGQQLLADEKHMPIYEELMTKHKAQPQPGGATLNTMRVCNQVLRAKYADLPPEEVCVFSGCVGSDDYAEKLKQCFKAEQVHSDLCVSKKNTPTGTCAVLVKDGERTLIANIGASNDYDPKFIDADPLKSRLASASIVYVGGYFLTVDPERMLSKIASMRSSNSSSSFCLNLGAPFLITVFKEAMLSVLPYADIVIGNEHEFAAFGEAHGLGTDLEVVAKGIADWELKKTGCRTVVLTQGSGDTIILEAGSIQRYPVTLVPKEELADTDGAGDAFVGGFLAGKAMCLPTPRCVALGAAAAAHIIQHVGCAYDQQKLRATVAELLAKSA